MDIQPRTASLQLVNIMVLTIKDRSTDISIGGASFNGLLSEVNGQVIFTPSQVGTFRYKVTRTDSTRSPAAAITVTAGLVMHSGDALGHLHL